MRSMVSTEFFDIAADPSGIYAASDFYIPFEINHTASDKNTQVRRFKQELRAAIQALRPQNDEILFAQYAEDGENDRFFDLENMLLYNLGPSAFGSCGIHGISFSALPDKPEKCREHGVKNRKYAYSYRCRPLRATEAEFSSLRRMATWNDVPLNPREAGSPAKYWKALRGAGERVTAFEYAESPIASGFALKIQLHLPAQAKLANMIKPLLDGVVCAFHGENADGLDCLIDFCVRHHCQELAIPNRFPAVLGNRELIRPYRNGQSFIWNPADDLCKLALVTVSYGSETPRFSGDLYRL